MKKHAHSISATAPSAVASLEPGELRKNTTLYLTIILLLPFLSHFLTDYVLDVLRMFAPPSAAALLAANKWIGTGITYLAFLGFTLFYLRVTLEPLSSYGWRWSTDLLGIACAIGVGSGLVMFGIDTLFPALFTLPPATVLGIIGGVITVCLLPALFEETLFRGVIQRFYARATTRTIPIFGWQVPLAVFIASGFEVLFHLVFPAYFHFFGGGLTRTILEIIPQLVYVAVFGAIGGYLYSRTGSLVAPIAVHFIGNFIELLLLWTMF